VFPGHPGRTLEAMSSAAKACGALLEALRPDFRDYQRQSDQRTPPCRRVSHPRLPIVSGAAPQSPVIRMRSSADLNITVR